MKNKITTLLLIALAIGSTPVYATQQSDSVEPKSKWEIDGITFEAETFQLEHKNSFDGKEVSSAIVNVHIINDTDLAFKYEKIMFGAQLEDGYFLTTAFDMSESTSGQVASHSEKDIEVVFDADDLLEFDSVIMDYVYLDYNLPENQNFGEDFYAYNFGQMTEAEFTEKYEDSVQTLRFKLSLEE